MGIGRGKGARENYFVEMGAMGWGGGGIIRGGEMTGWEVNGVGEPGRKSRGGGGTTTPRPQLTGMCVVSDVAVAGESPHEVYPAALKLAMRYHLQKMCASPHCVDSLLLYLNGPARSDGTVLLWDLDGDGVVSNNTTLYGHYLFFFFFFYCNE